MIKKNTLIEPADILMVGNADKTVVFSSAINTNDISQVNSMMDAINRVSSESFKVILINMSCCGTKLIAALEALSNVKGNSQVILLAHMYEEPLAREIVLRRSKWGALADDYHICPFLIDTLIEQNTFEVETSEESSLNAQIAWRDERIQELERLATEDDLTGIKNRRYIREFLYQLIEEREIEEIRIMLLLFDIDDFKHYNDSFGHSVGDNVLKQVAVMIKRCCREHDIVARIGGDEFAVVFWDLPFKYKSESNEQNESERRHQAINPPSEIVFIADRFRKELCSAELSFLGPSGKGILSISGGLATYPHDGTTVNEIFKKADEAMLDAKRNGKNQIYIVGSPASTL